MSTTHPSTTEPVWDARPDFDRAPLLVVEDSEDDVFLLQRAFQKAGLTNPIHVVADGEEAVAYLSGAGSYADRERHPVPAVVLLDLNLPRLSGHEVLAWIRRTPAVRRLPVYILSASTRQVDVGRALEAGANAYLVKPGRIEQLIDLARALRDFLRHQAIPGVKEPR